MLVNDDPSLGLDDEEDQSQTEERPDEVDSNSSRSPSHYLALERAVSSRGANGPKPPPTLNSDDAALAGLHARPSQSEVKVDAQKPTLIRPPRHAGVKSRVLHFTPSWFSVTMGTGVLATLINLLPWPSLKPVLRYFALFFLLLDIAIFITFTAAFVARYIMFPQVLPLTYRHPQKSMFLGTFPMALTTITSGIAQLSVNEFGLGIDWGVFASVLWWISAVIGLLTALAVPFSMMSYQTHHLSGTTAALLLPIVPPITSAAVGSVLVDIFKDRYPTYAFTILVFSYVVLGVGLPLALALLTLYLQRLMIFRAPPRDVIISVFLPLGPCGQGGEALLHLGQSALALFPIISNPPPGGYTGVPDLNGMAGFALYGGGLVGALLLWGLGAWWMFIGIATVIRERRAGRLPFNMGFWSASFPVASFAICTGRLALVLASMTFKVIYTGLVLVNLSYWAFVFVPTVKGFWQGDLLLAPCIADLPLDLRESGQKGEKKEVA